MSHGSRHFGRRKTGRWIIIGRRKIGRWKTGRRKIRRQVVSSTEKWSMPNSSAVILIDDYFCRQRFFSKLNLYLIKLGTLKCVITVKVKPRYKQQAYKQNSLLRHRLNQSPGKRNFL